MICNLRLVGYSESHAHVDNSLFISCVDYHTLCGCAFAASHCIHTFDWLLTNVTMDNQSTNERINNLKLIYSDSYLSGGFIDKHLKLEEKKEIVHSYNCDFKPTL